LDTINPFEELMSSGYRPDLMAFLREFLGVVPENVLLVIYQASPAGPYEHWMFYRFA
jgi:hypothetical protein